MLSALEQRQIIEAAFLPLICRCSIEQDDTMSVLLIEPSTGEQVHRVAGVPRSTLSSSRAISGFVLQVRQQLLRADPLRGVG